MKLKSISTLAVASLFSLSSASAVSLVVGDAGTVLDTNNWPGGEPPAAAVDGDIGTKYLNFAKFDTAFIFSTSAPVVVDNLLLATANDEAPRDPASYEVYGSASILGVQPTAGESINVDGFTLIGSGPVALSDTRDGDTINISLANTDSYQTYLVAFPTLKDAPNANSMQIAEARLQSGGADLADYNFVAGGVLDRTVVPEPSSALLIGLAGAFMMFRRRK